MYIYIFININITKNVYFRRDGKPGISKKGVCKNIGQIFIVRSDINQHCEILDSPEFLWETEQFKVTYTKMMEYLEIPKRLKQLNARVNILSELFDILNHSIDYDRTSYLTLIVIILLAINAFIIFFYDTLLKDILGYR